MLTDDEKLSLAAYVIMSSYRERALITLHDNKVMTPKYIAESCKVRTNHISKTLGELKENGLVVCINEEAHKGRVYKLTELGEEIYQILPSLKGKTVGELNDL